MVPSQAPKRELSRKAWSWRNAERNTSWTRSSTSGGGTRARRMPWTIRAYREYRRPNATRSPSRAAETSESCSRDSVTGQTVTDVKFHVCGSNVNPVSHVKPLRSEEHTSELQSQFHLVCRLLLEKKKQISINLSHPRQLNL